MTSLSLPDTAGTPNLRASICIIGAGLVGLTIANRLIASGKRVVVLESGPLKPDPEDQHLNEIDAVSRPYASATRGRYRGLGGSGIRWGGRFLPLASHEVGPRPYLGLDPWPLDVSTIARYQTDVDDLFGLSHAPFGDEARYILPHGSACPVSDQDIGVRFAKWAPFSRCNLATSVGPRLQAAQNIDLHTEMTVCDFEFDPVAGRLTKVIARDARGQKLSVAAEEFVLACGTIEFDKDAARARPTHEWSCVQGMRCARSQPTRSPGRQGGRHGYREQDRGEPDVRLPIRGIRTP